MAHVSLAVRGVLIKQHQRVAGMCKPGKYECGWSPWRFDHTTGKSI
nr:MAG TPA: nitrite reductase family protein [Caudoviricetes sp.]